MQQGNQEDQKLQQSQIQPQEGHDPANPTILLIEDDPVLSRMYAEKFRHEGFNVKTALDGEAGLQEALSNGISIILLDIMLPKMSGTDLLEKLRSDSKGKDIPVVALTNLAEQAEKDKAMKYGVKEYLVKAMQTPEQVVEKVKKYI